MYCIYTNIKRPQEFKRNKHQTMTDNPEGVAITITANCSEDFMGTTICTPSEVFARFLIFTAFVGDSDSFFLLYGHFESQENVLTIDGRKVDKNWRSRKALNTHQERTEFRVQ